MKARLWTTWEALRTSFWFVPALLTCAAAALALLMLALDAALSDDTIQGLSWVYTGGPEGARSLLATVASSVITVAGTTFSITIAALTLASSQFGPRLLRTFVRDTGNQVVLGTFVATFLYCLLVLRTIRGLEDTRVVPHLSVTVGVGLAIASLGVLIYFIHHVASAIQANHVIAAVNQDLDAAIERLFPEKLGHGGVVPPPLAPVMPEATPDGLPIAVERSGYLQVIDTDALLALATEHDRLVQLMVRPGDFIVRGQTLALLSPPTPVAPDVEHALHDSYVVGIERTQQQDVSFVIDQLVEIAVRALSTGINDPFTAIACIDRLGAALCRLAERATPSPYRYDEHGRLRVIAMPETFANLVKRAFDQIRQYGGNSVAVMVRLLEMLAIIAAHTRNDEQRDALLRQAELIAQGNADSRPPLSDYATVVAQYRALLQALTPDAQAPGSSPEA